MLTTPNDFKVNGANSGPGQSAQISDREAMVKYLIVVNSDVNRTLVSKLLVSKPEMRETPETNCNVTTLPT